MSAYCSTCGGFHPSTTGGCSYGDNRAFGAHLPRPPRVQSSPEPVAPLAPLLNAIGGAIWTDMGTDAWVKLEDWEAILEAYGQIVDTHGDAARALASHAPASAPSEEEWANVWEDANVMDKHDFLQTQAALRDVPVLPERERIRAIVSDYVGGDDVEYLTNSLFSALRGASPRLKTVDEHIEQWRAKHVVGASPVREERERAMADQLDDAMAFAVSYGLTHPITRKARGIILARAPESAPLRLPWDMIPRCADCDKGPFPTYFDYMNHDCLPEAEREDRNASTGESA